MSLRYQILKLESQQRGIEQAIKQVVPLSGGTFLHQFEQERISILAQIQMAKNRQERSIRKDTDG